MASQRLTLIKIIGASAELVGDQLNAWADARLVRDPNKWSSDQWPKAIRQDVMTFTDQLRSHVCELPISFYAEWIDNWSMSIDFGCWFTSEKQKSANVIYSDRDEIYFYALPDQGYLSGRLAQSNESRVQESQWMMNRLTEAVHAWEEIAPRAVILLIRRVYDSLLTDEDFIASLDKIPHWLQ